MAQARGADITQLAAYSDWGAPGFESSGWSAGAGFTGQVQDPGFGLDLFSARAYDPVTASFTSQDAFRGLLAVPKSLHRYGYVAESPVTLTDDGGNNWIASAYNKGKKAVKAAGKAVKKAYKAATKAVKSAYKAVSRAVAHAAKTAARVAKTVATKAKSYAATATRYASKAVSYGKRAVAQAVSATGRAINSISGRSTVSSGYGCARNTPMTASEYKARHPNAAAQSARDPGLGRNIARTVSTVTGATSLIAGIGSIAAAGAAGRAGNIRAAGVLASASAVLGVAATAYGGISILTGCLGYDWDGICVAQLITGAYGLVFLAAPPAAGAIFGVMTSAPYMAPGVGRSRDERWAQAHG